MKLNPTTTLAAERDNNSSAVNSFPGLSNDVPAPGHISRIPMGAVMGSVPIFDHLQLWWRKDGRSHSIGTKVGYDSLDPAQIDRQIRAQLRSGITGVMPDWYGQPQSPQKKYEDDALQAWFAAAARFVPAHKIAIVQDAGGFKDAADKTAELIDDANYAAGRYFGTTPYWRIGGRPVLLFFGDSAYQLDWAKIRAGIKGSPLFIFRNPGGFTHPQSDGAYAWTSNLDDFYTAAVRNPGKIAIGAASCGFNDSIASWTQHRITPRNNGNTWMDNLGKARIAMDRGLKLAALQLPTLNDYEEGTAQEPGISAGLSVSASASGKILDWTMSGNLAAIYCFDIFVSNNFGTSMELKKSVNPGLRRLDMSEFDLDPGAYQIYVRATAKPRLQCAMSLPASLTIVAPPASPQINVSPADGATMHNPVSITASANFMGRLEIWVDHLKATENEALKPQVGISRTMTPGSHSIVAQLIAQNVVIARHAIRITVV